MGVELGVLLGLLVGGPVFAPFEVETPAWRRILRWTVTAALTLGVYRLGGHVAVLVPLGFTALGLVLHMAWCRRSGVHPVRATPRRNDDRLRGGAWPDDER